jgi:20S proteasome alpha/beta subunit
VHGRIYEIGMNYDWCHDSAGLYAVGTGAKYALGALDVQLRGKKLTQAAAKEALSAALAAACTYDPNSAPPINLLVQSR